MNSASERSSTPSPDAGADAKDAAASSLLDDFNSTTISLLRLADWRPWRTAKFSALDVMEARRHIRTCQQSLNRIESELDKRA
jgi:hypothetical protein